MMGQRFLFLILSLAIVFPVFSQTNAITREANMMSDSDEIALQELRYFRPGGSGKDVLWDFSGMDGNEEGLKVSLLKDTLNRHILIDGETIRYYALDGDSLTLTSSESPLSIITFEHPQLVMRYPLAYGDSVSSPFLGQGVYCGDHHYRERGQSSVIADAMGRIVLDDDTIPNVLRTYSLKSYSICMDMDSAGLDTAKLKQVIEERYDWYAQGYRYPVFTTVISTSYDDAVPIGTTQRAYCMLPDVQNLQDDPYNRDVRRQDSIDNAKGGMASADIFHYSASQYDGHLTVDYSLDSDADITVLVSDVMGVTYRRSHFHNVKGDGYTMSIDCSGLRYGQYILYLNVNGKIYSENITIKP